VGRLPDMKTSAEMDRPQVRTPDGFVLRRTGGYNVFFKTSPEFLDLPLC